jgi:endonuclease G
MAIPALKNYVRLGNFPLFLERIVIMCYFVQRFRLALAAFVLIVLPVSAQPNRNIPFGKPVPITKFADPTKEDHLIERAEYVLSFNGSKNIPNWVAWNLVKEDIGNQHRGAFEPDPILPKGFDRVTSQFYNNCGFDRGHMCDSKDRSNTRQANDNVFFMTNIIPQSSNNNQKGWERLETYCRDLAQEGNSLYIVCGPTGQGGEGKLGHKNFISLNGIKVVVPSITWKVIVVLPEGAKAPDRNTRTIAVMVPNDQSVDDNWAKYRVSARHVEEQIGYTLFPNMEKKVADAILDRTDTERITTVKAAKATNK